MSNLLDELDFKDLVETNVQLDFTPEEITPQENDPKETKTVETGKVEEKTEINFEDLALSKEDVEDKTVKNTEAPPPKNTKQSSNVPFALVFKSLVEEDAFSSFDEEEFNKDIEENGLAVAYQNAVLKDLENRDKERIAQLEEDMREYTALKDAGVDTEVAQNLIKSKLQFDKLTEDSIKGEDNLDTRKAVLTRLYELTTGFSSEKITREVNKTIAAGEDEEEAVEALTQIKEIHKKNIETEKQKIQQAEEVKKKQYEENLARYKATISGLEEPFPGVKINKQTKEKIEKAVMSGEIWKLREKDPAKFDAMLGAFYVQGGFEGKFKIAENKAKTTATKMLEEALKGNYKPTEFKSNTYIEESDDDTDDVLRIMKSKTNRTKL